LREEVEKLKDSQRQLKITNGGQQWKNY
jgi:hypothetical protein